MICLCINQFQRCPSPPPPGQPRGICSNVSPGGGALAILSQPGGWALAWLLIQRSVNNQVLKNIYITVVRF